jgi:hypothetical protein
MEAIQNSLSLALSLLKLKGQHMVQGRISEVNSLLRRMQASQINSEAYDWLQAPDAFVEHNINCAKHVLDTSLWFLEGPSFKTWFTQSNSFLWTTGCMGCGKSVLCSTAIQHTFRMKTRERKMGVAFFYFAFDNELKQDQSAMVRALLQQLAGQMPECEKDIQELHDSYGNNQPTIESLIARLQIIVQRFSDVYLFLDGLDECPRPIKRAEVLATIKGIRQWNVPGLHIYVSSRDLVDIRESLKPLSDQIVSIGRAQIDQDIEICLAAQLDGNPELQKWHMYHENINQALLERAQGV